MTHPDQQPVPVEETIACEFESFGLSAEIVRGLKEAGFKKPSPIQEQAIPYVLAGKDMIAQAQTGTGKTAAFGLPVMSQITQNGGVEVLVVTPTRELASQVSTELFRLGKYAGVKTVAVYGGQSITRQVDLVNKGAQVLVATPGRLLDHLRSGRLKGFAPKVVILDEADEMLDMGFLEDIEAIFEFLPKKRQTLLFSATMPKAISKLGEKILNQPVHLKITSGATTGVDIEQRYYVIAEHERTDATVRLLESEGPDRTIIFCRTKRETEALSNELVSLGYVARALHGDMDQKSRERSIGAFKNAEVEILVATDVAARGLDVTGVSHVINYHMPFDAESYVHRIGRTGRAGKKGVAITLVSPFEFRSIKRIQEVTGAPMVVDQVPSIKDVETLQDQRLVQSILESKVTAGAQRVLARMEQEIELKALATKLLSMIMEKTLVSGPDQIGMRPVEIERLEKRSQGPARTSGGSGGPRRPYKPGNFHRAGKKPFPAKH